MKNDKLVTGLLGISLFAFSVASFSRIMAAISLGAIIIVYALLTTRKKIFLKFSRTTLIGVVLFNLYIVLTMVALSNYSHYAVFMQFFVLYLLFFLVLTYSDILSGAQLDKAIKIYLAISIVSVTTQLFSYLLFGHYIKFNEAIRDSAAHSAYSSKELVGFFMPIRVTGFFSEPSFYAMSVLPGILYLALRNKTRSITFYSASTTVYLSLSVAAFIVMTLFLLTTLLASGGSKTRKIGTIIFVSVFTIAASGFIYERTFNSTTYNPIEYRMSILDEFKNRDGLYNIIGAGYFLDESGSTNGVTGLSAAGVRDSGVYASTLYSGGVIGLMLLMAWIMLLSETKKQFVLIAVVMLMKYSILSSAFWMIVILVCSAKYVNKRYRDKEMPSIMSPGKIKC